MTENRATIFVMDAEDHPSEDYIWVVRWLAKWDGAVVVKGYSTGGWEHLWDIEGPDKAIREIPHDFLCQSEWVEQDANGWKTKASKKLLNFDLSKAQSLL